MYKVSYDYINSATFLELAQATIFTLGLTAKGESYTMQEIKKLTPVVDLETRAKQILYFQSEPMSSNMLAEWQVNQGVQQIEKLVNDSLRDMLETILYDHEHDDYIPITYVEGIFKKLGI